MANERAENGAARATRRALLKTGILGSMVLAIGGGVGAAFSAMTRSAPRPWRVRPLVNGGGSRPEPVLYETGSLRTDFFLAEYPKAALQEAEKVYEGAVLRGMEVGVVAVSRRCPHLGAPVDWCRSSQWFECQMDGSLFNAVGERKSGPAPSGMRMYAVEPRADGNFDVRAGRWSWDGAPKGTDTTGQRSEGPSCHGYGGGE